ncbi:Tetratricopeptide repeat protein 1 [Linum perenne]
MDSLHQKEKGIIPTINTTLKTHTILPKASMDYQEEQTCTCFFCTMKQSKSSLSRRKSLASCLREMTVSDSHENVLILSGLWSIAMNQPDDSEFPSLGVFSCMASLIQKSVNKDASGWLLNDQSIYIPYYAAHVIGSYTMNKVEFAEMAVKSGVILPLMELFRGKISWVEQRVAVRALGHLSSYDQTFEAVAVFEEEVVELAMELASTATDLVYSDFVGVKDKTERLKYHCDLLTKGIGCGSEMEDMKAEEWASQLQCWCLYLLNCFASKGKSTTINLICSQVGFLESLSSMWGGLVNHSSPAGIGLIRILCYHRVGRRKISESKQVIQNICNISRSSDEWQYMGIDCLLLLLKDQDTRYRVLELASSTLVDLVELKSLGEHRSNVGESVTEALLLDYKQRKVKLKGNTRVVRDLEQVWKLKVERRRRERAISEEKVEERKVIAMLIKQQGYHMFLVGEIEKAFVKYSEALEMCPLRYRKERLLLYSNRAQCSLVVGDWDGVISDSTRALSLSSPANSHRKSLWRRAQAYDMKGMAKESLMDCFMFINNCMISDVNGGESSGTMKRHSRRRVPYNVVRLMGKQMDATWLFANAAANGANAEHKKEDETGDGREEEYSSNSNSSSSSSSRGDMENLEGMIMRMVMKKKEMDVSEGLSTIVEEPLGFMGKEGSRRKMGSKKKKMKKKKKKASMSL